MGFESFSRRRNVRLSKTCIIKKSFMINIFVHVKEKSNRLNYGVFCMQLLNVKLCSYYMLIVKTNIDI